MKVLSLLAARAARGDRALLGFGVMVAGVAAARAVHIANGAFEPTALKWLTLALASITMTMVAPSPPEVDNRVSRALPILAVFAMAFQFAEFFEKPPAIYLRLTDAHGLDFFQGGIAVAAVLAASCFNSNRWVGDVQLPLLLAVHLSLGVWLIRTSPDPFIDVFPIHQESVDALLHGVDPYTLTFRNIYGNANYFGPGLVADGRLLFGYPYAPLGLLFSVPGKLFFGDYRYSLLVAMSLTGALLGYSRRGTLPKAAAALFLFMPRSFFVLEQGWTETYVVFCLALCVFTACRTPKWLPVALGLFLASKQYAFLFAPAALLLPSLRTSLRSFFVQSGIAVGVALIVTLPFVVWQPKAFYFDVIGIQFLLPFRDDSLNYAAWWVREMGTKPAGSIGFAALCVGYVLTLLRAPCTPSGFAASVGLLYFYFITVNRQAFCNSYFLIVGSFFASLASLNWTGGRASPSK